MDNQKQSFTLGLAIGIAAISLIGLIIVSAAYFHKGEDETNDNDKNNNAEQVVEKDFLTQVASGLKLNMKQFNSCLSSKKYANKVDSNLKEGQQLGVTGTPGSFINGEEIKGALPFESIKTIIEKIKADPGSFSNNIAITADDNIRGPENAPITFVVFSDFQCPFCSRFHNTVKQVMAAYPNDVRLVYKHFPLDSIHPYARKAAEATECAGEQNKFWEFSDKIFENQKKLSS